MSIEIRNVTKHYGNTCALKQVNTVFEENKIYGLLGRNGAGKSTLLNLITNRIFPDDGSEILVDGIPVLENDSALRKIYLMSEKNSYPGGMRVKEIFHWTKRFYPEFDEEYAKQLAVKFELNINKKVNALSTGFTSIFKVIIALSVNTPYVFLDEPVLGLDANNRDLFYRVLIEKYSMRPCTLVISTHLIEEVSNVIEQIIIIKNGKIIADETRDELLSRGYTVSGTGVLVDEYIKGKNVIGMDTLGGLKSVYILGEPERNGCPEGIEISRLDLQKLFVQLTNV